MRPVKCNLGPTPSQECLLRSYGRTTRVVHNGALTQVRENLLAHEAEHMATAPVPPLPPAVDRTKAACHFSPANLSPHQLRCLSLAAPATVHR